MIIATKILVSTAVATLLAAGSSEFLTAGRQQATEQPAVAVAVAPTDGADGRTMPVAPGLDGAAVIQHCTSRCDWDALFSAR